MQVDVTNVFSWACMTFIYFYELKMHACIMIETNVYVHVTLSPSSVSGRKRWLKEILQVGTICLSQARLNFAKRGLQNLKIRRVAASACVHHACMHVYSKAGIHQT